MRSASLCSLLAVILANAGNARAVDYCPLQLQGQFGNNYYYFCQTVQGGTCTYTYAMVGTPYQCGGCCTGCCGTACVNGFTKSYDNKPAKNKKAPRDSAPRLTPDDSEVVPHRNPDDPSDKGEAFATADERFCAASNTISVVDEVWLHVPDSMGKLHYFRCFDVISVERPGNNLRVGREVRKKTWTNAPATSKRAADRDGGWQDATTRFHRVTINDGSADKRVFYLISVDDIE